MFWHLSWKPDALIPVTRMMNTFHVPYQNMKSPQASFPVHIKYSNISSMFHSRDDISFFRPHLWFNLPFPQCSPISFSVYFTSHRTLLLFLHVLFYYSVTRKYFPFCPHLFIPYSIRFTKTLKKSWKIYLSDSIQGIIRLLLN